MTRPGRLLVRVAAVATLLTACTSNTATSRPAATPAPPAVATNSGTSPAPGEASLPCPQGLDAGPSELTGFSVVLGVVALPVGTVLGAGPAGEGAPGTLFAKQGLAVRVGAVFDLEVAPGAATHARIGWGSPGTPATELHVNACAGQNAWLAYPGGYWVDKPLCLPLIVRAHGQEETVNISIGVQCPANASEHS